MRLKIIIVCMFTGLLVQSQEVKFRTFYDAENKVTYDFEEAKYFGLSNNITMKINKTEYDLKKREKYYMSGSRFSTSYETTERNPKLIGQYIQWFKNGIIETEGEYYSDLKKGLWTNNYENGELKSEIEYVLNDDNSQLNFEKIITYSNPSRNLNAQNGIGDYMNELKDDKWEEGPILNGLKTDVWHGYYEDSSSWFTEEYNEGKFIKGESIDENGVHYLYDVKSTNPKPKNGFKAFYQQFVSNLEYPQEAIKLGVTGRVYIQFEVDKDGTIKNIQIARGIGAGCDEAALKAFNKILSVWEPGFEKGIKIKQKFTLPIRFNY